MGELLAGNRNRSIKYARILASMHKKTNSKHTMNENEKPTLLRIIPPPAHDDGFLLLTTAEYIARARETKAYRFMLRDAEGRFCCEQAVKMASKAMNYDSIYGAGRIMTRLLDCAETTIAPYDGSYVKPKKPALWKERQRAKAARVVHSMNDDTNAACDALLRRKGELRIVFGEIARA